MGLLPVTGERVAVNVTGCPWLGEWLLELIDVTTVAGVVCSVKMPLVAATKLLSPLYLAVIMCLPPVRAEVVYRAVVPIRATGLPIFTPST